MIELNDFRNEIEKLGLDVNVVYTTIVSEVKTYNHGKYIYIWQMFVDKNADIPTRMKWYKENVWNFNMTVIPLSVFDKVPYIGFPTSHITFETNNDVNKNLKLSIVKLRKEIENYIDRCYEYGSYNLHLFNSFKQDECDKKVIQESFKEVLKGELKYLLRNTGDNSNAVTKTPNKIAKLIKDKMQQFIDNFKLIEYNKMANGREDDYDYVSKFDNEKYQLLETNYKIKIF